MGEMKTATVVNKALLLGNNHFETGLINLGAGLEITDGAFLKRTAGHTFEAVTDTTTEEPVAILPVGIKNSGAAAKDFSIRACLDGKVRVDMLHVDGTPATPEQIDLIRKYGFIPVYATDLSRLDNI
jgi:hypothetical protein